ncbi:TIGR00730 family Rossman fold protein [Enterovirga rhinocerotis]|uniref:Cytokinin riboside 5'-monophosphate phosphoribohydrolase n=1 Tax=Enterovirga rhinocerotis TaxID=1339210 RepID=A0A4R7CBC1_9HYPH|nr:TIGR00730 family Rossman fold protein [Enterovirga rhinocerotis]TDR94376.1 hypothetical protein EV668_1663 [Enterovirga rhinocerotis]
MRDEKSADLAHRTRGSASRLGSVCVYCGSSPGADPAFAAAAEELGRRFAESEIELVYGGGNIGLMGTVARATLDAGGRVTGIIPDFLKRAERMLDDVQELIVVPDMHTRKQLMFERADAFVAMPGGIGTLEELIEQMTWAQLGRHRKPILLLDIGGFWRPLLTLIGHMGDQGFIRPGLELTYLVAETPADVLPMLEQAMPPPSETAQDELVTERF